MMLDFPAISPRFVLLLGDGGAWLGLFHGHQAAQSWFAAKGDEAARQELQQRLAQNMLPVTIVMHGTGQDFRVELMPLMNALDRGKLMRRRLAQAYPQAFATACRRLDATRSVFAALQARADIQTWVDALAPERLSMGLLPVESAGLMQALLPESQQGWAMLLAGFASGGLRQMVTADGVLTFTRHSDMPQGADSIARLIEDSRAYLARFGLSDGTPCPIVMLADADEQKQLQKIEALRQVEFLTPCEAAKKLGLLAVPPRSTVDMVFAAWLARRRKLFLPLLPAAVARKKRDVIVARAGLRVAVGVGLLALAVTGWDFCQLAAQLYRNHHQAGLIAAAHRQLLAQQAGVAPTAQPIGRLRAALERQRLFGEKQQQPWDLLQHLATALDGRARIVSFDWRDDDTMRLSVRLEDDDAKNLDRAALVGRFQRLVQAMAHDVPAVKIDVVHYPFPALPGEVLSNQTPDAATVPTAELLIRRLP